MRLTKLNDVYKNWSTGDGVFTDLNAFDVPWKTENNVNALNMAYHGSHSGDKNISPVVNKFLELEDVNARSKLASIIITMYNDKWAHLWSAMALDYNPIENYNMTESETPAETTRTITPAETTTTITPAETTETITPAETTETITPAETTETITPAETTTTETPAETTTTETPAETTKTVTPAETTETITPAETTTTEKPAKTTTENEISAFNSSGYEDNEKTTVMGDANDKGTTSIDVDTAGSNKFEVDTAGSDKLTVDHAGTTSIDVDTAGSNKFEVDTAGSEVYTTQNPRELTRSGNIGTLTTQNMLDSEIRLRQWLFYENVFKDIDNILTLSIY